MVESANTVEQEVEENVSLPSEENAENVNPWDASGLIGEDGSIDGYKSFEGLLKSAKESQEYITKLQAENQSIKAKEENKKEAEVVAKTKTEVHSNLVGDIVRSNGELTQEILDAANEAGLDVTKLELDGMKALMAANKIFDKVGGKEAYMDMINVVGADFTDEQKAAFSKDISSSQSEVTLAGLKAMYAEKTSNGTVKQRVSGVSKNGAGSVKPYSSLADMEQDIQYLQTRGRGDKARQNLHMARRRITPDSVFYN